MSAFEFDCPLIQPTLPNTDLQAEGEIISALPQVGMNWDFAMDFKC